MGDSAWSLEFDLEKGNIIFGLGVWTALVGLLILYCTILLASTTKPVNDA
jgi:hypothetical protein